MVRTSETETGFPPSEKEPEEQETKSYKPILICKCGTELKESNQEGYWVCPKCHDIAAVKDGKVTSFSTDPSEVIKESWKLYDRTDGLDGG